ncbi:MAG: hypothetical protein P0S93_01170 [Candidatus Neptunochlamydia sp.]|nr:hypothetical protein [Candidatus Neptunochlamydia sp.]
MESIQSHIPALNGQINVTPTMEFEALADEIDIYSQSTFQEIQDQRFKHGLDLYICVVREGEKAFYFDASKFMEDCIRNHRIIDNPFTRNPFEDFEIYVSTQTHPNFKLFMRQDEALQNSNYYPVYWNDPNLSKADRLIFMTRYAKHFETTDIDKALAIYKLAAERGSTAAKLRLASIYIGRNERDAAVHWLYASVQDPNTTTENLFACAKKLIRLQAPKLAVEAYTIIYNRGNQYGLGAVIRFYEQGYGTFTKDPIKAAQWRQQLPPEWRDQSITAYFAHLQQIQDHPVEQNDRWSVLNIIYSTASVASNFFSGIKGYFSPS